MENNLRDDVQQRLLQSDKKAIVLELPTSFGKTALALKKIEHNFTVLTQILIVIPRNVLVQNWKNEFIKWGYADMLGNVTFTTYVSFPKYAGQWDIVVFDEAHHLSERCREAMSICNFGLSIYLSATLKKYVRDFLTGHYGKNNMEFITVSTKKAIDNDVLPDPKIILIPLQLDTKRQDIIFEKNKPKHGEKPLVIPYEQKWKYRSYKGALSYRCNQRQYYIEISGLIEWYKKKNFNPVMKNIWLHKCGVRLQWLSMNKLPFTMKIVNKVVARHQRFVVFCNTIPESQALHLPMVNSQIGSTNLERFNAKEITDICAVNMLNEGINLVDCQVGIFNAINASDIYQIQKGGRLLRHKEPVMIIPYFKDTREEEIVNKWMQNFDKELIETKTIEEL